jgi:hypothetical protein
MKFKDVDIILKELEDTFEYLVNTIKCPVCNRFVHSPFYPLGKQYNWFEGCKECSDKIMDK